MQFNNTLRSLLAAICLISISACGDGDTDEVNRSFSGVWDVRYNLQVNDCGIVASGVPGFVDQHSINSDGVSVTLDAVSGFVSNGNGIVRSDDSFALEQTIAGDIFGDGIFCSQLTKISYDAVKGDVTSSLFFQSLECADGFSCISSGIGEAKRQSLPVVPINE